MIKFVFSKKATKFDKLLTVDSTLHIVKSTVKISSIFVVFLEDMNFKYVDEVHIKIHTYSM